MEDVLTYYLKNLSSAKGVDGQWGLEYAFDSTYGLEAYNATTLKALTESMDKDSHQLSQFAKYILLFRPRS